MRPIPEAKVHLVRELSARYPHAHGAPVHVGDPEVIGITNLGRPDYGEPVPIYAKDIPVFWGCGATPQAVAAKARVELMITHEPPQMFLTHLPREGNGDPDVGLEELHGLPTRSPLQLHVRPDRWLACARRGRST